MGQRDITGTTNMRKKVFLLTAAFLVSAGCIAQTEATSALTTPPCPCIVYSDYAFPIYNAPQEWVWSLNDTLTITWQSAAPLQKFDYRLSYDDSWHTRECRGAFSIPASELKNTKEVEWRIIVGCNKINNDAVYGTVEIIHPL